MSECVKSVKYKTDEGQEAFAFVLSKNENGSLNLAVVDPDTYQLHAANEVPADSDRLS